MCKRGNGTIDGKKAFYVIRSDIYGPMGHEFIPFSSKEDAQTFVVGKQDLEDSLPITIWPRIVNDVFEGDIDSLLSRVSSAVYDSKET